MPTRPGKNECRVVFDIELLFGLFGGGNDDAAFERFAIAVKSIDILSQYSSALWILRCEQFDSELCLTESPGGVQTGCESKSDIFGCECALLIELGLFHEGFETEGAVLLP